MKGERRPMAFIAVAVEMLRMLGGKGRESGRRCESGATAGEEWG